MLKKEKLNATKEEEVLCAFLKWADAPGRELSIIEKIAPLVRFPLVRFPLGDELKAMLKRLCDRSEVVKDLFDEAVQMQCDKGANGQVFTRDLKKHRLLDSEEEQEVPRLKKRKMCENDEVPALTIGQIGAALMARERERTTLGWVGFLS